jgi:hypothetical protein
MGKGKGKLKGWFCQTSPSITFVEYKNLRVGRSNYFLTQLANRLPVRSRLIYEYKYKHLRVPISASILVHYQPFK